MYNILCPPHTQARAVENIFHCSNAVRVPLYGWASSCTRPVGAHKLARQRHLLAAGCGCIKIYQNGHLSMARLPLSPYI